MNLRFPPLAGGTAIGLNDAGVETFEGNYPRFIVRECAQNSLDAAADHTNPVKLSFRKVTLNSADIPFHQEIVEVLISAKTFWEGHSKATKFFELGLQNLQQDQINFLVVSDSGTTGVPGGDEDTTTPWYGLVKSRGVSNKPDDGSGGSFGIGKDAPFAASACRTVLYSTRTQNGNVAFQGISRLVTHLDPSTGKATQGNGFIGNYDSESECFSAIRSEASIPNIFRRKQDEAGLDVWIPGYKFGPDNWEQQFIAAALANFWPAIHFGKIEFEIGHTKITKENLAHYMTLMRDDGVVKQQLPFFESLISKDGRKFDVDLPTAGICHLYVITGRDLPKRIAMSRKTGMIIYNQQSRVLRLPFAGLFICESEGGNSLLKTLEPPTHDKWDEKRNTEDPTAKKALAEIKHFIRETLRSLIPDANATSINENLLSKFLPEENAENSVPPETGGFTSGEPELGGAPRKPEKLYTQKVSIPVSLVKEKGGDSGSDKGSGGGGSDSTHRVEGTNTEKGGVPGSSGDLPGEKGGYSAKPQKPVFGIRSWISDQEDWDFDVILRSNLEYSGSIVVNGVGEDGKEEEIQILQASESDSGIELEATSNRIRGVTIKSETPKKLRIKVGIPGRISLRVKPA